MDSKDQEFKIIHLRMHQVRKLKELKLSRGVFNTEALMLVLNKEHRTSDGSRMLFKYLDLQDLPEVMDRKTGVLSYLNNSPYKDVDDLIIPEFQMYVDCQLAGFAMPLIEDHKNLGAILHSKKVPFKEKKELLIKLGNLIDKVDRVKADNKLFFADLNEYNFILDNDDNLKAIDLDSSFVEGLEGVTPPSLAYYLLKNESLNDLPSKYKKNDEGVIIPSMDTDLYSYNMIVMDVIANHRMFAEDMGIFYKYLYFLDSLGVDSELIESFMAVYSNRSNFNPRALLEGLDDTLTHRSSFKQFQKKMM